MTTEPLPLRDDQIADLAFYMANPKGGNLSEPGAGKTPSVCVMEYFRWTHHKHGTVWVMPKSLLRKNKAELHRFTRFTDDEVVIVDGTAKQVERQLSSGAAVFLMGFRRFALSWRSLPDYVRAVDVDEFHMGFKSSGSQASQALFEFFDSGRGEWFLPMTGTLIDGRLDSAYPAIRVIEPRYYANHDSFIRQHAVYDIFDSAKIVGWQNHDKLRTVFGRHFIRRTFKDIHGDQEIVHQHRLCVMNPRQREQYDKFEAEAILDLEKFYLDGTMPGSAYIRACQLMEHPNMFPDLTSPGSFIDTMPGQTPAKEDMLEVDLEDHANNGKPLLIFSSMVPQQYRISALLTKHGIKHGVINGDTPAKLRDQYDEQFRAGEISALVCSEQCAAVGYNWQFCGVREVDHVIFLAMGYLDTIFLQARQRAIRQNRSSPLRVSIFEYEDSIDQNKFGIILRKSIDAHRVDPTRPIVDLRAK